MAEECFEYVYDISKVPMLIDMAISTVINIDNRARQDPENAWKLYNRIPRMLRNQGVVLRKRGKRECNFFDFIEACRKEGERRKEG